MLPAMVLAAGLGTRLRPLTDLRAKAVVPIGDRPVLAHVLDRLWTFGPRRVVVNAHHRVPDVRAFIEEHAPGVEVSEESELLGTAGGIARAATLLGAGDVLVWNADAFATVPLDSLASAHAGAQATLVVRLRSAGEGNVGLDDGGRIVRLRSRSVRRETRGGDFVGIHILGADLRRGLPPRGCIVGDVYIPAMVAGVALRAFVYDGPFFDVGTPRGYLDANLAWLEGSALPFWAGPGAIVDPVASLVRSVVGEGAEIAGRGPVERCVIWPGARANAPLADSIVAGVGIVVSRG